MGIRTQGYFLDIIVLTSGIDSITHIVRTRFGEHLTRRCVIPATVSIPGGRAEGTCRGMDSGHLALATIKCSNTALSPPDALLVIQGRTDEVHGSSILNIRCYEAPCATPAGIPALQVFHCVSMGSEFSVFVKQEVVTHGARSSVVTCLVQNAISVLAVLLSISKTLQNKQNT